MRSRLGADGEPKWGRSRARTSAPGRENVQAFYSLLRLAKIRKPTNQRAFLHTTKRAKRKLFAQVCVCLADTVWVSTGFCLFLAQHISPFLRKKSKAVLASCLVDLRWLKNRQPRGFGGDKNQKGVGKVGLENATGRIYKPLKKLSGTIWRH